MKTFDDVIQDLINTNDKLLKGSIDINTAKVIANNTQILINAAKVNIDFMRLTGAKESNFMIEPASETVAKIKEDDKKLYELGPGGKM